MFCYLCEKSCYNGSQHQIPKDLRSRGKWLKILELSEEDANQAVIKICGKHFEESCFHFTNPSTGLHRLKPGSIPTLHLSKSARKRLLSMTNQEKESPIKQDILESRRVNQFDASDNQDVFEPMIYFCPTSKDQSREITVDPLAFQPLTVSSCATSFPPVKNQSVQTVEDVKPSIPITHNRKNIYEPQFLSQCTDFSTPTRAKRCFTKALNVVNEQRRKIKMLQQKTRNLEKKVTNLNNILRVLRKKDQVKDARKSPEKRYFYFAMQRS